MVAENELVVLRYEAFSKRQPLEGTLREWKSLQLGQRSFQRSTGLTGGSGIILGSRPPLEPTSDPDVIELIWSFTYSPTENFLRRRIRGTGPLSDEESTLEANDGRRFVSLSKTSAYINASRQADFLKRLLDPSWLLTHDLEILEAIAYNDRSAHVVSASARPQWLTGGHAVDLAKRHVVVVDDELGFLHRASAMLDDKPFDELELLSIKTNTFIDPEIFTPAIPTDLEVVDFTNGQDS